MASTLDTADKNLIQAASVGAELFNDVLTSAPVVSALTNRKVIAGTVYKGLKRSANPAGGWRTINSGVAPDSSTYENTTVNLALFDQPLKIDAAFAKAVNGTAAVEDVLVEESKAAAESLVNGIDYAAFNLVSNGCSGFDALAGLTVNAWTGTYVSGISGEDTSRAYFVKTPELEIVFGGNDLMAMGEWDQQLVSDGNGGEYKAYVNSLETWVAFNPKSSYSIARVVNISEDSPFTDALVSEVVSQNKGKPYDVCFLSRNSLKQLQDSRATALSGSSAAIQESMAEKSYGIKLVVSDNIADDNTALDV